MKRIILITGGQRSGKSVYAENLALSLSPSPIYLATAHIWDDEFMIRVKKHQERRGSNWTNIEEEKFLSRHNISNKVCVIDCLTLWCTNFFYDTNRDIKDQPSVGLYNQKNQLLVQQTGAKASSTGWLIGSLRNKTVDVTQNSTTVNQPAAVYTAAAVLPSEKTTSVTLHTQKQTQGKEQQLIQLWQQASKAERQKFMSWLAEQAN